jgi:hypothetical protein
MMEERPDREWYDGYTGEEDMSKAVLAYVDAHPGEFFVPDA